MNILNNIPMELNQVFTQSTAPFNNGVILNIMESDDVWDEKVQKTKVYIETYWFTCKSPSVVLFWDHENTNILMYTFETS